jgi:hypothetical protein
MTDHPTDLPGIGVWRLETHGKLATAHKVLMADYEEKLTALQLQAGVAIHGHNPAANIVTIESELKKNCISILTLLSLIQSGL